MREDDPTSGVRRTFAEHAYVGRQPIYDASSAVVGYELLYRQPGHTVAEVDHGSAATSDVILSAYVDIGLAVVTHGLPAWVNFDADYLLGDLALPFKPKEVVIEVLEHVQPTADVCHALERLRAKGYRVALDDFVLNAVRSRLLEFADIVKIDVLSTPDEEVERTVHVLRSMKLKTLLAEKIEGPAEFARCRGLGFDLFQGYFLCRPEVVKTARAPKGQLPLLRLMSALHAHDVTVDVIAELVSQDVGLSYRLLRLVNAPGLGLRYQVDSVPRAIAMLGMNELRRWTTLLLMASTTEKPRALLFDAMVRGKMCEAVAHEEGSPSPERHFMVGLFSVLDALLDLPMREVVEQLDLPEDTRAALVGRQGDMGRALACAIAQERGDWDTRDETAPNGLNVTPAWIEAIQWAADAQRELLALARAQGGPRKQAGKR